LPTRAECQKNTKTDGDQYLMPGTGCRATNPVMLSKLKVMIEQTKMIVPRKIAAKAGFSSTLCIYNSSHCKSITLFNPLPIRWWRIVIKPAIAAVHTYERYKPFKDDTLTTINEQKMNKTIIQ
jgi:hypothetical protein